MATQTLQQLLTAPSLDDVRAKVLAKLQTRGLPTTDWGSFSPERAMVELVAEAVQDLLTNGLPTTVGGGLVDYSTGDWLTLLSQQRYNNTRGAATYTFGTIVLTNSTAAPIPVQPDSLWFLFPSGNRYHGPISTVALTIPANGTLPITVQSESPNHSVATSADDTAPIVNYVDPSNTTIRMVTSLVGVTASNPAATYSAVSVLGSGSGTISISGTPTTSHSVSIRIDVPGQSGTASWSYSLDGTSYVSAGAVASALVGDGMTVTLANGAGTPSFNAGDILSYSTPGTWITSQGTDQETDPALQARDKARWPSLATVNGVPGSPTGSFYDLLVRQLDDEVTQTLIQTDATVNNRVNIYVAGQGGLLPSGRLAAIQAGLNALQMQTDDPRVLAPAPVNVTLGGLTIYVKSAYLTSAQGALQAALQTYFGSLGINASADGYRVKHGRIIDLIETTPGVTDLTDTTMTINGVVGSLSLPTTPNTAQVVAWTQAAGPATTWATWVTQ